MENNPTRPYEILVTIVNFGIGTRVVNMAKACGISGGTIFLARGTTQSALLDFFELGDERKELVLNIAQTDKIASAVETISKKLRFEKPNHGIAFTASLNNFLGVRTCQYQKDYERKGVSDTMHEAIFVVVDRGLADSVVEAAKIGGARGGTIINARGSGIHEYSKLFAMDIEPEKEIVLVIAETSKTESIVNAIIKEMDLDEPGKGILFTLGLNRTFGLYPGTRQPG